MNLYLTHYPERYVPCEETFDWFDYELQEPTHIGSDASAAPNVEGTIIGAKDGAYFLDTDAVFANDPDFHHFIWLRDRWNLVTFSRIQTRAPRSKSDIETSFALKEKS